MPTVDPALTGIQSRSFSQARKGFDPDEVRAYLQQVDAAVAGLIEAARAAEAAADAARAVPPPVPPEPVDRWSEMGDHVARILAGAEAEATAIRAAAEADTAAALEAAIRDRALAHQELAETELRTQALVAAGEADAAELRATTEPRVRAHIDEILAAARAELTATRADLDAAHRQLGEVHAAIGATLATRSEPVALADAVSFLPPADPEPGAAAGPVPTEPTATSGPIAPGPEADAPIDPAVATAEEPNHSSAPPPPMVASTFGVDGAEVTVPDPAPESASEPEPEPVPSSAESAESADEAATILPPAETPFAIVGGADDPGSTSFPVAEQPESDDTLPEPTDGPPDPAVEQAWSKFLADRAGTGSSEDLDRLPGGAPPAGPGPVVDAAARPEKGGWANRLRSRS